MFITNQVIPTEKLLLVLFEFPINHILLNLDILFLVIFFFIMKRNARMYFLLQLLKDILVFDFVVFEFLSIIDNVFGFVFQNVRCIFIFIEIDSIDILFLLNNDSQINIVGYLLFMLGLKRLLQLIQISYMFLLNPNRKLSFFFNIDSPRPDLRNLADLVTNTDAQILCIGLIIPIEPPFFFGLDFDNIHVFFIYFGLAESQLISSIVDDEELLGQNNNLGSIERIVSSHNVDSYIILFLLILLDLIKMNLTSLLVFAYIILVPLLFLSTLLLVIYVLDHHIPFHQIQIERLALFLFMVLHPQLNRLYFLLKTKHFHLLYLIRFFQIHLIIHKIAFLIYHLQEVLL